jgi:hypothetical protein
LVIATAGSAVVLIITDRTIEAQLNEMRIQERPWVGVDYVRTAPIEQGKALPITVIFKNSGKTPAMRFEARVERYRILLDESTLSPLSRCDRGACSVGVNFPNAEFPIEASVPRDDLTFERLELIKTGVEKIYIQGRTDYVDNGGTAHKTIVCMFYNPTASRFGYWLNQAD